MREALKARLIRREELRLRVYDDKEPNKELGPGSTLIGHPTIGIGRCLDLEGITAEEANYLCDNDIARIEREASFFPWFKGLTETRQDVILEMLFEMGYPRFLEFRRMIAALQRGDYNLAASEMLNSAWAAEVKGRAVELADLMRAG